MVSVNQRKPIHEDHIDEDSMSSSKQYIQAQHIRFITNYV